MGRKYDGLMFNKHKNNPQMNQQQLAQCHTKFITLRRKCTVMLEKEVSRARYLAENNKRSKECEQRIKLLYYLIGLIDDGVDRLYEIHSVNELNSTFNELNTVFNQLNGMASANDKIAVKSMPKPASPIKRTNTPLQSNAGGYKATAELQQDMPQGNKSQPVKPVEAIQPAKPKAEAHKAVDDELEEINMYLEGFFED